LTWQPMGHLPGTEEYSPRPVALATTTSLVVSECHASVPYFRVGGCAVQADSVRRQAGARLGESSGVRTCAGTDARTTAGCCSGLRERGAFAMDRTDGPQEEWGLAGISPATPSIKTTTSSHTRHLVQESITTSRY